MSTVSHGVHGETQAIPAETQGGPIIISRVINLFLILLYVAVLVVHVVCLAVLAAKHNEIVGKFEDDPYYQYPRGQQPSKITSKIYKSQDFQRFLDFLRFLKI